MSKYFQAPWDIKDVLLGIIISSTLLCSSLLILHFFNIKELTIVQSHESTLLLLLLFIQWVMILGPILIIILRKHKFKFKDFGIEHIGIFQTITLALSGYITYIIITLIIGLFILFTNIRIPGYEVQEKILPFFDTGTLNLVIAGIFIVVLAPIIEEIFFRGIILRSFINKWGIWAGSIITALLFAMVHSQWQSIIPIFILGLIINTIVIKGRSIIPAIIFHIFNNGVVFTLELLILKDIISIENIV